MPVWYARGPRATAATRGRRQARLRSAVSAAATDTQTHTPSTTIERPGTVKLAFASPARTNCAIGSMGRNSCAVCNHSGIRDAGKLAGEVLYRLR